MDGLGIRRGRLQQNMMDLTSIDVMKLDRKEADAIYRQMRDREIPLVKARIKREEKILAFLERNDEKARMAASREYLDGLHLAVKQMEAVVEKFLVE